MFVCALNEVGQILPAAALAPFAAAPAGAAAGQVRRQTRLGVTTMPPKTTLLQPSGAAFGKAKRSLYRFRYFATSRRDARQLLVAQGRVS